MLRHDKAYTPTRKNFGWDKPILYFHGPEGARVRVRIDTPLGKPLAYWPKPEKFQEKLGPQITSRQEMLFYSLTEATGMEWSGVLSEKADGNLPLLPAAAGGHWWARLRDVEAKYLNTPGGSVDLMLKMVEVIRASEAPVIRLVNAMIAQAVEKRASDIHIEPFEKEFRVRYRVDGVLYSQEAPPRELKAAIISRVKLMAKLNIAERRLPQDGRIKVKTLGREVDLRVSTLPTLYGESVVMRLLDRSAGDFYDLRNLGFDDEMLKRMEHFTALPHGIFLVTGPTGSGKSTTLYSALKRINQSDKKIITIEDPVEYQMDGINQIHVNAQIGLTFATGLRHIVRQDPDVIMVGEIRDRETADTAIRSALTGHFVYSTLHTNDAPSAITRLTDMGVENYLICSSLVAVLAQRLVRVICPFCKQSDGTRLTPLGDSIPHFRGAGCERCFGTGYQGRIGIFELMELNDAMRKLIMANADAADLTVQARKNGMRTLREDGWLKVSQGVTTADEVMRVTQEF